MGPCNVNQAEDHNFRRKHLDYVREELSTFNITRYYDSAQESYKRSIEAYIEVVGQKPQKNYAPIQEIIVVGLITEDGALKMKESLETEFRMRVLSWAIHMDEGHYDIKTHNWIPNHHCHIIVDTTCWSHERQLIPMRKHGIIQRDPHTNDVLMREVDMYGHKQKYNKDDMSRLQDIAAEITGWERGTSSNRKHLNMIQYKVKKCNEDLQALNIMVTDRQNTLLSLKSEEDVITSSLIKTHIEIESSSKSIITEYESIANNKQYGLVLAPDYVEARNTFLGKINDTYDKDNQIRPNIIQETMSFLYQLILIILSTLHSVITGLKKELDRLFAENQQLRNNNKEYETNMKQFNHLKERNNAYTTRLIEIGNQIVDISDSSMIVTLEKIGLQALYGEKYWNNLKNQIEKRQRSSPSKTIRIKR